MMFRVKLRIPQPLVERYIAQAKTGVTGVGYVRLDPNAQWPSWLDSDLVQEAASPQKPEASKAVPVAPDASKATPAPTGAPK